MDRKHKVTIKRKPREWGNGKANKQTFNVRKDGKLDTWRPTKKTPEVLQKLKYAYMRNCTDAEACAYAEIWESTLNKRKDEDPNFIEQIRSWRAMYIQAIKFASYDRAMDKKNRDSTDILFKVDKSYSDKSEVEHKWEISLIDIAREMQQKRLDKEKWDLPTK